MNVNIKGTKKEDVQSDQQPQNPIKITPEEEKKFRDNHNRKSLLREKYRYEPLF